MDSAQNANIFFFISSVGFIIVGLLLAIALVYIIKILGDIKHISSKAKIETDHLAEDIQDLRTNVKQEGVKIKHIGKFFNSIYKRYNK